MPEIHAGLSGPFPSWSAACQAAVGFDSPVVLDKVSQAVDELLSGRARYERDGTIFAELPAQYKLRSLLSQLLSGKSCIVDFGGGLAGTYLNNRDLFPTEWGGRYVVVEQAGFCARGRQISADHRLPVQFLHSLDELRWAPDITIFSGVLSYIDNWQDLLRKAIEQSPEYVIIDRQILSEAATEIYVQENDGYYNPQVSYPVRLISRAEFLSAFRGYRLIESWPSDFDPPDYHGFLFQRTR